MRGSAIGRLRYDYGLPGYLVLYVEFPAVSASLEPAEYVAGQSRYE